jgi:alpha-tubulin suppressor-like RCC1 family protein
MRIEFMISFLLVAAHSANYDWNCVNSSPLAPSDQGTCLLNSENKLKCFGMDKVNAVSNAPTGTVKNVYPGKYFYCSILSDDTLYCWGDNNQGQIDATPTSGTYKMISCGISHCCAIESITQSLKCWGQDNFQQVSNAPTSGTYDFVDSLYYYSCAIRSTDKSLICWGNIPYDVQSAETPLSGTYNQVSFGQKHACVILSADRSLKCWGINDLTWINTYQVVSTTPTSGTYDMVSCGYFHTCALRSTDHGITCWGNDEDGQVSDAPTGTYNMISCKGGYHCCASSSVDGKVTCWGRDLHKEVKDTNDADITVKLPSTCVGSKCAEENAMIEELNAMIEELNAKIEKLEGDLDAQEVSYGLLQEELTLWKSRFENVEQIEEDNRPSVQAKKNYPLPENEVGKNVASHHFSNLFSFTLYIGLVCGIFGLGKYFGNKKANQSAVYTEMVQQ